MQAVGVAGVVDVAEDGARVLHAFRIEGAHLGARILQGGDDGDRGRLAHVVGVGLEGEAQHRNRAAAHAAAAVRR